MADTNAQMEELARILEDVNREMAYYGRITKQTADDKFDAEMKNKTGINNATKGLASLGEGLTAVAGAGMAAGKAMYEGKKGAAAFNDSIDGLTKAAQAAGIALSLMIPGGPLIKLFIAGLTAAVTATAEYVKAANDMADKLYKGYSGLAKSGAAASDGMTGVYNGAKKLGLSMNELDGYIGLIGQNSKDLALLAGSVYEGRQQFEDMGQAMEPYRKGLIAAGISQEMINEGSMGYLKLQTRIGVAQRMTTDQLAEGARRYLIEQDALTKLTGTSRKEIEDQMEAARSEQRFRAKLEEVRATQGEAAAKRLENANIIISSQSKEMGQAFRDTSTGMLTTEAALKGNMTTQGELMRSTQQMLAGQKDEFQAVTDIGKVAKQFGKDMNMSAQLGVLNDFAIDYAQTIQFGIFTEENKADAMKKIVDDAKKQGIEGGKAADGITDQYAKNIKQQQELNKKMEDAVFKGIENALSITNKLGNVTEHLATVFDKLATAANKLLRIIGLGVDDEPTEAEKKAADIMKGAQGTVDQAKLEKDKAFEGATFSQRTLGIGLTDKQKKAQDAYTEALRQRAEIQEAIATDEALTAPAPPSAAGKQALPTGGSQGSVARQASTPGAPSGSTGGGNGSSGPPGGAPAKPNLTPQSPEGSGDAQSKTKPEDVIKFTARSGSKEAFEALGSGFKNAVIAAAEQYKAITGNTIQLNSAKRDPAEQQRLYDAWIAGGKQGMPVAMPGRSLHEKGEAVDIQNYNDPKAVAAFNQQGLSQKVPNDPVHFQARDGGVFNGPKSGYNVTLHGNEAVIPLKSGAVPINLEMPDVKNMFEGIMQSMQSMKDAPEREVTAVASSDNRAMTELANVMREQTAELINAMSEMIREQKNSTSVQERILQTSM
jgi:LAS superfamily LD-carboxypeptidase LdcB